MESQTGPFERLREALMALAGGVGSKAVVRQMMAELAGVALSSVAVSLAKGGTRQLLNRFGQAEIGNANQLTIFIVDPGDVPGSIPYTIDAIRGRNDATAPVGPVAFVALDGTGGLQVNVVQTQATSASRLMERAFGATVHDPVDDLHPRLATGQQSWLLMSNGADSYFDQDGIRYHFKVTIPNGRQLDAGHVVAVARTKTSLLNDRGNIIGLGRIGRHISTDGAAYAYVYFDRYLALTTEVSLEDFGKPNTNVNSIVRVDQSWFIRLMKEVGVEDIAFLPVPFTAMGYQDLAEAVRSEGLVLSDGVLQRVLTALRSGKHLMFTGPPGTGKTSLALAVAAAATQADLNTGSALTTGTADWTSADTVGAYRLGRDQQLTFAPGSVVTAITGDRWLVIDELNRADIDKAVGQLFTVLSGQAVTLPFEVPQAAPLEADGAGEDYLPVSIVPPGQRAPDGTVPIHMKSNWRLLATLNDRDRDLLFDMSEALMRRFAVIEVDPPDDAAWRQILIESGGTGRGVWDEALRRLPSIPALRQRPIGAAILLDCVRHLRQTLHLHEELDGEADDLGPLQEVLDMYVQPQLRILDAGDLEAATLLPPGSSAVPEGVQTAMVAVDDSLQPTEDDGRDEGLF